MSERDLWICERCGREAEGADGKRPVAWHDLEANDVCGECWEDFKSWWSGAPRKEQTV